ncbi:MAG: HAD family hydrolase [Candidatus Pacearchaeota archaeon]|nr:HAD family hydrolase [Candidatus Pacearchaeota archaeon]
MIKQIGFDLDNTLYKELPEVHQEIHNNTITLASRILGLEVEDARRKFDEFYNQLGSGSQTLMRIGITSLKQAKRIVQEAIDMTDTARGLTRDERLAGMLERFAQQRGLYLITTSPKKQAYEKFNILGVNPDLFGIKLYGDSDLLRDDGSVFRYVSKQTNTLSYEIMFVGDREKVDILPAKALGMKTAIVNATSQNADYNLGSIYDLENIVNSI